jgi:hypothetical protein
MRTEVQERRPLERAEVEEKERERGAREAYVVFCCLWAVATLFHLAADRDWDRSLLQFALTSSAVWLLVKPSSIPRLLILALLQIMAVGVDAPHVSNHWLFTAFVNVAIVGSAALAMTGERRLSIEKAQLYAGFAPVVRIGVIILYFFAVLHKLNTDFLAPEGSCGTIFYLALQDRLPFLPDSSLLQTASIYGTILVEAAIPILLCLRKTRMLGVFLGAAFHSVVGFNPVSTFYDFSSMLFAVFILFAPEGFSAEVRRNYDRLKAYLRDRTAALDAAPYSGTRLLRLSSWAVLCLLLLVVSSVLLRGSDYVLLFWFAYSSLYVVTSGAALFRKQEAAAVPVTGLFRPRHAVLLVIPALIFLNGLSPYLGLKTENSFAMFSNLRTEGGQTNHLFIPAHTQLFDFQQDLVEVTGSSAAQLQVLADEQKLLPYLEFRIRAGYRQTDSVTYIRNGKERIVPRVAEDPELGRPVPLHLKKLLWFRPVDNVEVQECRH